MTRKGSKMIVLVFYKISTSYVTDNHKYSVRGHIRETVEGALAFETMQQAAKWLNSGETRERFKDCQMGVLRCEDMREKCGHCKWHYEAPKGFGRCSNALSGRGRTESILQACGYFKEDRGNDGGF